VSKEPGAVQTVSSTESWTPGWRPPVVLNDIEEGRLIRLDIDTTPTTGAIGVMSIADEVPTPAFRAFSTALQHAARKAPT